MEQIDLFKYKIFCETEGIYVEGWYETDPEVCPNNNSHTISPDKTTIIDERLAEAPTDVSGKPRVITSSRRLGLATCWTGAGDDINNFKNTGDGIKTVYTHTANQPDTPLYIDFNCVEGINMSYIFEAYFSWENFDLDDFSVSIVPRITPYTTDGTETGFALYGNLIIPTLTAQGLVAQGAPGVSFIDQVVVSDIVDGAIDMSKGLVYVPIGDLGYREAPGFFNAEVDDINGKFVNITSVPDGSGEYNLFCSETEFSRPFNRITLMGTNYIPTVLDSEDAQIIGAGMRVKFTTNTNIDNDRNYRCVVIITAHRKKSC